MAESEFTKQQREALEEVLDILGTDVTIDGVTYKGVVNALETSNELKDGGDLVNLATTVILARCDFTAANAPRAGQKLTVDGEEVRIEKVDKDETSYMITCVSPNK